MKKAMLSQPMAGKTEKEIVETRARAIAELSARGCRIEHEAAKAYGLEIIYEE